MDTKMGIIYEDRYILMKIQLLHSPEAASEKSS